MSVFSARPGRAHGPHEQFFSATVMIGFAGDTEPCFGSGFLVGNASWRSAVIDGKTDCPIPFLVTARHVVAELLFSGRQLRFMIEDANGLASFDLPLDGWCYSEDADIAIIALPDISQDLRLNPFRLPLIFRDQFFVEDWRERALDLEFGDPVRFVGLWYVLCGRQQLIVRGGHIATATIAPVQTPSGATRMYLIDATVTRAMSGGPCYVSQGKGWAQSQLLGVTFGYWPLDQEWERAPDRDKAGAEGMAERNLLSRVERLNSRLALVTPIHHVAEVLNSHPLWRSQIL